MGRREFSGITEQRKAALKRKLDAEFLLDRRDSENWFRQSGKHARGAMYLAGYAVECKLKAIAMEIEKCHTLEQLRQKWRGGERDIYDHGLEALARRIRGGLWQNFRRSLVWRDFREQVNRWRPSWRYDPQDHNNAKAAAFLDAVNRVYNWLEANRC